MSSITSHSSKYTTRSQFEAKRGTATSRKKGTALILVLVLLSIMMIYALSNQAAFSRLDQYLDRLEQKHQHKFDSWGK